MAQYQEAKLQNHDPEALHALLWEWARNEKVESNADRAHPSLDLLLVCRSGLLLKHWKPGQTDILKTRPDGFKEPCPLWDLYLLNPEEAWKRGVSAFGEGGK